jgi:hypothetical protein
MARRALGPASTQAARRRGAGLADVIWLRPSHVRHIDAGESLVGSGAPLVADDGS